MRLVKARETVGFPKNNKKNLFANINICFNYSYPPDGIPQHTVQELPERMRNGSTCISQLPTLEF